MNNNKRMPPWLRSFLPHPGTIDRNERMRAALGALFGIFLTGLCSYVMLGDARAALWLIAPMGASAVLLFAVPASPLAQPWSITGGNLLSALIGVSCAKLVGSPVIAAAFAASLSIAAMFYARCLHPPSGAVALTAVLGGPAIHAAGYEFVLVPVALNSLLLLLAALFYNNATGRRYPHPQQIEIEHPHATGDLPPSERLGFTHEDLEAVLQRYNQVLDVSRDDIEALFRQTEMQAYRRRFGEVRCADIMSRDVVTVEFATELEAAWGLLREHRVEALPVVDRARRVIGILTPVDFLRHADIDSPREMGAKLRRLLRRTPHTHSDKPEVVGQIMTMAVKTAPAALPIVELVSLMSDAGLHHIPVVDEERRLAGMVTQSDLLAAIYRSALESGPRDSELRQQAAALPA